MMKTPKGGQIPKTPTLGGKSLGTHIKGSGIPEAITGASPMPRMMGNYSKTPPAYLAGGTGDPIDPTGHPGAVAIRGGSGGIKTHPKLGGIGPGPMGATGTGAFPQDTDQS
jgi:hypothetical protein